MIIFDLWFKSAVQYLSWEFLFPLSSTQSWKKLKSAVIFSFLFSLCVWSRHVLSTRTCRWSWFFSGIKVIWECSFESKSWPNKGIGQSGMYRNLCCKYVFPIIHCNSYRKCWYSDLTITPVTWTVCHRSPVIFSFKIK